MSSPDDILARELHARAQAEANEAAAEERKARGAAAIKAGRLQRLLANEDVQWLLAEKFAPIVAREQAAALNIARSAHERDLSAHRHALALEFAKLLAAEAAAAAARAQPEG